ncbi:hypothetical protein MPH_11699 [Macrophomina phaseolina MS6]|uniref:DUF7907 domain-containing protein n=1 Tax=Macrophomina phaseolina (strain MS6) TaxID=1126212 RepID=K2R9S8_MACPH|nr:hypothetical protein MPH_11699 [Macrophomina phaseolina MS6]
MKVFSVLAFASTAMGLALPIGFYNRDEFFSKRAVDAEFKPTGEEYLLKTQLVNNNDTTKAKYNNLYLTAFHTGAGTNDAVLTSSKDSAATGFLNETADGSFQEFDFGNDFPWTMKIGYEPYAAWAPVTIDAGLGDAGDSFFTFTPSGLTYNVSQFDGWLVCDWWHTTPQLFWKTAVTYYNSSLPTSCADVYLVKESL